MRFLPPLIALLACGCGCGVTVLDRTAEDRPPWLTEIGSGRSDGEASSADAIESAALTAAAEVVATEVGVVLGATFEAVGTYDSKGGDTVAIRDAIRTEARAFVRYRVVDRYAKRVRDGCADRVYWRGWAVIDMDRRALRTGVRGRLAARGPRLVISREGERVRLSSPTPLFGYAFVGRAITPTFVFHLEPGAPQTFSTSAEDPLRVFASPQPIATGPDRLRALYDCLSLPGARRCSLTIDSPETPCPWKTVLES